MAVLVIAEHDNAALREVTLHAVAAAQALGAPVDLLVAGAGCGAVADAAARIAGLGTVLLADDAAYEHALPEAVAPLVVQVAADYDYVLAAASTTGKNLMPRVAALLDVAQVS